MITFSCTEYMVSNKRFIRRFLLELGQRNLAQRDQLSPLFYTSPDLANTVAARQTTDWFAS